LTYPGFNIGNSTRRFLLKEGRIMEDDKKEIYVEPKIVATYTKEELEETIRPHGSLISPGSNP
jgi:hypothetical protein